MYECHKLAGVGYNLKSRFDIVRLISCLPKSNKGMKDDYLIVSGEWHGSSLPNSCGGSRWGTLGLGPLGKGFSPFSFIPFHF